MSRLINADDLFEEMIEIRKEIRRWCIIFEAMQLVSGVLLVLACIL